MPLQIPELLTALDAARRAAKICTAVYATLVEAASKAGREPVTVADYASQAIINARLLSSFPHDTVIGEEHADEFDRVLSTEQRVRVLDFARMGLSRPISLEDLKAALTPPSEGARQWIVDPIDGTKGFLAKRSYAIAIALQDEQGLKLGVLACPNLSLEKPGELSEGGVIFYALRGEGAYRQALSGGEAVRIHVSPTRPTDAMIISTSYESEHSDKELFNKIVDNLPSTEKRSIGMDGQGKYGLVADGRVCCFFRLVPDPNYTEKVWDHAAGTLIVQEAGGTVTDFRGQPLDFTRGRKLENNHGILATNGVLHAALLQAIEKATG